VKEEMEKEKNENDEGKKEENNNKRLKKEDYQTAIRLRH
jgi:hypothetical protein